jgi:PAS domain S-box-containing protein
MPAATGSPDRFLERMTDAFIALDREWRVVYINSAAMGLNTRPRPDVIGRSHWDEWPMTVGSEVERQYRLAMSTQRPVHFEHHYVLPGQDFWHSIHAYPDETGLSIFFRDITVEKRAEELAQALGRAGSRFAATLDLKSTLDIVAEMALPCLGQWGCVYLVDEGWRVTASAVASPDAREHELLRRIVNQLPITATDERLPFNRAMHSGAPVLLSALDDAFFAALGSQPVEDFLRALDAQSLLCAPLVAHGRTIGGITFGTSHGRRSHDERDVDGAREVAFLAGLAVDSARLFEAERRARHDAEEAKRLAEEANRGKVEFLRAISHELRTPLNAIGGYAQMLRMGLRGELTAQQRSDVERIERNHLQVARLIDDLMSFARLETGRVDFDIAPVPVAFVLGGLEAFVAPSGMRGGRALLIGACPRDVVVRADEAKMTQVLSNLVSNAMKHTPPGTTIEVFCEAPPGDNVVYVRVRDTGPGIPRDKQKSIFAPFVQLDKSLTRRVEGLGLGLAIARDLARGMGGDLTVDSQLGQGATFTLSLPRARA